MAIVPEYGGPQVMPAVGAGTQGAQFHSMVAPKAELVKPFEKVLDRVGRMQAALLEEQDDAIATDIDTKYAQYCQQLLRDPDKGFLTLKGRKAVEANDGVAPIDAMMQNADAYLKNLMDGRTKDQIARIKAKTDSRTNGLYASGMQHAMTENYNFNVSSRKGALEQAQNDMMTFFDQPDKQAAALARLKGQADAYARLTGASAKTVRLEAVAGGHKAAVLGYLMAGDNDPSKYAEGMNYLKAHRGEMNASEIFSLGARLNDGMKKAESWRLADEVFEGGRVAPSREEIAAGAAAIAMGTDGKPTLEGNEHYVVTKGLSGDHVVRGADGEPMIAEINKGGEKAYGAHAVTRTMAETAAGRKLSDDEWKTVRENPQQNKQVAVAYLQREGKLFGDFDQAVAAFVGTEKEVATAVEKAKKEGGVWSTYLSQETLKRMADFQTHFSKAQAPEVYDADGSRLNAFSARFASRSYRRMSRDEIRRQVMAHPLAVDQQWADQTIARIEARYVADKADYEQRHQAALDDACRAVEAGREPSEATLSSLTAREQQDFYAWRKKHEASDTTGDLAYAVELLKNPAELAAMSEVQLRNALRLVPKSSRGVLQKSWQTSQNARQGMLQAEYAAKNGTPQYGKTEAGLSEVKSALQSFDKFDELDDDQKDLVAGEVMFALAEGNALYGIDTSDKVKATAAILDLYKQRFTTDGFIFGWGRKKKSLLAFKYGDLPSDVQSIADRLGDVAFNRDKDGSTKGERMAAVVRLMTRQYTGIRREVLDSLVTDKMRTAVGNHAWEEYRARGGAGTRAQFDQSFAPRMSDSKKVLKAYIDARLGGQ